MIKNLMNFGSSQLKTNYKYLKPLLDQNSVEKSTYLYIHGYLGSLDSETSKFLLEFCEKNGCGYLAIDLYGHGGSEGELIDCTVSMWRQQVLDVSKHFFGQNDSQNNGTSKKIVVGKSIGGYFVALNMLNEDFNKIWNGSLLICPAIDYPHRIFYERLLAENQKQELNETGVVELNYYGMTWKVRKSYIEDSRDNNDLFSVKKIPIPYNCTILQGRKDTTVNYNIALDLSSKLISPVTNLILTDDGGHDLKDEKSCKLLTKAFND